MYQVLEELGSPLKLANEYHPQKRYLIGPSYYDHYLAVLKLVIGICITVSVGIAFLETIINPNGIYNISTIIELFANVISGAFMGAIQGALWVTIIFVILERSGVESGNVPFHFEKWTPDLLPELPINDHLKISRGETIFSMITTIVFTVLLYLKPQLIAIYTKGEDELLQSTSLFEVTRLKGYMIFIFIMAILQLGVFIWKYITKRWNLPLILCNAIYNILACILLVVMISDNSLINGEFVSTIAELTKGALPTISVWFHRSKWIFAIAFIGICMWDSIAIFYKYITKRNG